MASEEPVLSFNIVSETRKDSNEPHRASIPQDRPASAVKPRSLFSRRYPRTCIYICLCRSAVAIPRAHVGGLRVPHPGRSTYPDGNPRTAGDVYMRWGLLLVVGEKCHRRTSGKRGELIIVVYRGGLYTLAWKCSGTANRFKFDPQTVELLNQIALQNCSIAK